MADEAFPRSNAIAAVVPARAIRAVKSDFIFMVISIISIAPLVPKRCAKYNYHRLKVGDLVKFSFSPTLLGFSCASESAVFLVLKTCSHE